MTAATRMPDHPRVESALTDTLQTYGHHRLELEFRLGHRTGGRFLPGVTEAAWEALKHTLDCSCGEGKAFEVVVADTVELISDDGSGGKYVVDNTGAARPYWMHKRRLWDFDADTRSAWCCRTSASLEAVDPPHSQKPPPAGHQFERHKRRWSYKHRCWSFDLTRVTGNLPHQLDNDGVSYEVELELADPAELFARPTGELLEWGWKMVGDVCSIMDARA